MALAATRSVAVSRSARSVASLNIAGTRSVSHPRLAWDAQSRFARDVTTRARCPLQMCLVRFRHVLGNSGVVPAASVAGLTGHALIAVQAFHGVRRHSQVDHLADQRMWHAVEVAGILDVVVDIDPRLLPLGVFVAQHRQRPQRRPIEGLEGRQPRSGQLLERFAVQLHQQAADGRIERRQTEERLLAQHGKDPAFDDLHRHFGFGLVLGFIGPRRGRMAMP